MSFWTDATPVVFAGANAEIDTVMPDLAEATTQLATDGLASAATGPIRAAQDWAAPLIHEWDTTKAAFLDAIGAKVQASVAQSEGNYRASIERGDSLALRTYVNIMSSEVSGFASAAGKSFAGPPSLVLDPVDSVLGMGVAALDTGSRFALAGAEDKLHMLVNGATQLGTFAAMSGGLNVGQAAAEWRSVEGEYLQAAQSRLPAAQGLKASDADWHAALGDDGHLVGQSTKPRPAALEAPGAGRSASEQASAEAASKLTTFIGEGLYAPNSPAQRSASYSPAPTPGDLSSILGTGLYTPGRPANGSKKLDRDFSSQMLVSKYGVLSYPPLIKLGNKPHHLKADVLDGTLTFAIKNSVDAALSTAHGFGDELFASMMKAYARHGVEIDSLMGDWNPKSTMTTNLSQFLELTALGLPPTYAAGQTFTGRQAAAYGLTHVDVPDLPSNWPTIGVEPLFRKIQWGDPQWAEYATRLGTGTDRRAIAP